MANEPKSPAQALHAAAMELKAQLDRARQLELDESHGRAVGGLALPGLREGEFRLPPDNSPTQPLVKK